MSSVLFDNFHYGLQNVLDLRSQQHSLTAGNLANADTPGYRARYIPFDRLLGEAVSGGGETQMTASHERHLSGLHGDAGAPHVEEMEAPPWSADGNSVQLERETARLTENSMLYGAVSSGLSRRLAMLRFAANNGRG